MKHLLVCREYPPAPSGGIGVYAHQFSGLLAERGDTVHVIGQLWGQRAPQVEVECDGRLIIHRVPYENGAALFPGQPHPGLNQPVDRCLFASEFPPQCFAWRAASLAERLVEDEGIDVIEAQEYEAPLYYFQLRRALGLGPSRQPPCVVHLHSPTEFIARHNGWELSRPDVVTATRLEEYSIAAADSLLCPSRYLARQAELHYRLTRDAVEVIPYPLGDRQDVSRTAATWQHGTICYVGRLEPRKGVLEWVDAAVAVAADDPMLQFVFIGSDTIQQGESVRTLLERRIPTALKAKFQFLGERSRREVFRQLARARLAVVPSRWENFPHTCLEAMSTGLPVVASREGGMSDLIDDGQTGWLSETPSAHHLAAALRRALRTCPATLAEMGRCAAVQIRRMCENDRVVDQRRDYHRRLALGGPTRSVGLPRNLARGGISRPQGLPGCAPEAQPRQGIAMVLMCSGSSAALDACLECLAAQTQPPILVVLIESGPQNAGNVETIVCAGRTVTRVLRVPAANRASARNTGIEALLQSEGNLQGIAILSVHDRLSPTFVAACGSVLTRCPEVGLISCWSTHRQTDSRAWIKPCPSLPYQWVSNDAAPFSVLRTEALREVGGFRPALPPGYDHWDLCNAVLSQGWIAVTIPEILGQHACDQTACPHFANGDATVQAELLARFPDLVARDAPDIQRLQASGAEGTLDAHWALWVDRFVRARVLLRYPGATARQLYGRLKHRLLGCPSNR